MMHNIDVADPGILFSRYYLGDKRVRLRLLCMTVNTYDVELGDVIRVVIET